MITDAEIDRIAQSAAGKAVTMDLAKAGYNWLLGCLQMHSDRGTPLPPDAKGLMRDLREMDAKLHSDLLRRFPPKVIRNE